MWARAMMLMLAVGCVGVGDVPDRPTAAISENSTVKFHCLNHESIHIVTCSGSISLFPITININSLRILSDNEIDILSGDLDDLSLLDGDVLDDTKVLNDVQDLVLDDFLNDFRLTVHDAETAVCTTVGGSQVCV